MSIFGKYVAPRIDEVAELIAQNPFRTDFGGKDIPTLIALVFLHVVFEKGRESRIIRKIERISTYDRVQVKFVLDQYTGIELGFHLWRRSWNGRYHLLI